MRIGLGQTLSRGGRRGGLSGGSSAGGGLVTAGLFLHYDTDIGRSEVDAAGRCSELQDQSPSGAHLVQASAGNQPPVVSAWQNGKAALQGGAGTYSMQSLPLGATVPQPMTWYAVGETPGATTVPRDSMCGSNVSGTAAALVFLPGIVVGTSAPTDIGTLSVAAGEKFVMRAYFDGASSEVRYAADGKTQTLQTENPGTEGMLTPRALRGGSSASAFNGKLASWLAYDRLLTAQEDDAVMQYLQDLYALTSL